MKTEKNAIKIHLFSNGQIQFKMKKKTFIEKNKNKP